MRMGAVLECAFESPQKKSLGNESVRRVTGPDIKSAALLQSFETAGVRRVAREASFWTKCPLVAKLYSIYAHGDAVRNFRRRAGQTGAIRRHVGEQNCTPNDTNSRDRLDRAFLNDPTPLPGDQFKS
jgi:hypothetical protein